MMVTRVVEVDFPVAAEAGGLLVEAIGRKGRRVFMGSRCDHERGVGQVPRCTELES